MMTVGNIYSRTPMGLPNGWFYEDVFYPGASVICVSNPDYFRPLARHLNIDPDGAGPILVDPTNTYGIAKIQIDGDDWNRDPIIRTQDGIFLYVNNDGHDGDDRGNFFHQKIVNPGFKYTHLGHYHSTMNPRSIGRSWFFRAIKEGRYGFHKIPFAGGQLITGRRYSVRDGILMPADAPVFIVGKGVVYAFAAMLKPNEVKIGMWLNQLESTPDELWIRAQKLIPPPVLQPHQDHVLSTIEDYKKTLAAKTFIRSFLSNSSFGLLTREGRIHSEFERASRYLDALRDHIRASKKVIYVDQWAYHIDLQIFYFSMGIFLVHDFDETLTVLRLCVQSVQTTRPDLHYYIAPLNFIIANTTQLRDQHQGKVDNIVQTLMNHGFKCIRICGLIIPGQIAVGGTFRPINDANFQATPELGADQRAGIIRMMNNLSFNFMNSIPIQPETIAGRLECRILYGGTQRDPNYFVYNLIARSLEQKIERESELYIGMAVQVRFEPIWSMTYPQGMDPFFQIQATEDHVALSANGGLRCSTMLVPSSWIPSFTRVFLPNEEGDRIDFTRKSDLDINVPWIKPYHHIDSRTGIIEHPLYTFNLGEIKLQTQQWSWRNLPLVGAALGDYLERVELTQTILPQEPGFGLEEMLGEEMD